MATELLDAAVLLVSLSVPTANLAGIILHYTPDTVAAGTPLALEAFRQYLLLAGSLLMLLSVAFPLPARVMETALGFVQRFVSARRRDLVPVVSLALLVLIIAYLLAVVERGDVIPELKQAAAALSAAVLGWLRNLTSSIKLTIAFRIFGFEIDMVCDIMLAARN